MEAKAQGNNTTYTPEQNLSFSLGRVGLKSEAMVKKLSLALKENPTRDFSLEEFSKDKKVKFSANLDYSAKHGRHFLNSVTAQKGTNLPIKFSIDKNVAYTMAQIYNLMVVAGAVHKEGLVNQNGETFSSWVKLKGQKDGGPVTENGYPRFQFFKDPSEMEERKGFDLHEAVNNPKKNIFLITEAQVKQLKNGSEIKVMHEGEEYRVKANPEYKNFTITNKARELMRLADGELEVISFKKNETAEQLQVNEGIQASAAPKSNIEDLKADFKKKTGQEFAQQSQQKNDGIGLG